MTEEHDDTTETVQQQIDKIAHKPTIEYCSCSSTKAGIYERLATPGGGKRFLPSFICPDCKKHRRLQGF